MGTIRIQISIYQGGRWKGNAIIAVNVANPMTMNGLRITKLVNLFKEGLSKALDNFADANYQGEALPEKYISASL